MPRIVYFIMDFKYKVLKFILTHPFFVSVTVGLGHGVDRKLYTSIGGQRAEKFENHWSAWYYMGETTSESDKQEDFLLLNTWRYTMFTVYTEKANSVQ